MQKVLAHLEGKSQIIWDWNGTLLNDLELCVKAVSKQLEDHGLARLSAEEHRSLFGFPVRDFYSRLGFDFKRMPFEEITRSYHEIYAAGVASCNLFAGTRELLRALHEDGMRQFVLSAALERDLLAQIDAFGIAPYFERIYGLPDQLAASKIARGRALLAESGIDPATTLLIGDTDHDAEVGEALGVDVLLLADGHQTFERLSARGGCRVLESRFTEERE